MFNRKRIFTATPWRGANPWRGAIVGCALAMICSPAWAGPSGPVETGGQLAQLNGEIANLRLELEIAKLQAGIAKARNQAKHPGVDDKTQMPTSNPAFYPGATPLLPGSVTKPSDQSQSPRVLMLEGSGNQYHAELAMPDGGVISGFPGENIGNGWVIDKVNAQGVVALHKGKAVVLQFSPASATQETQVTMSNPTFPPPALPEVHAPIVHGPNGILPFGGGMNHG